MRISPEGGMSERGFWTISGNLKGDFMPWFLRVGVLVSVLLIGGSLPALKVWVSTAAAYQALSMANEKGDVRLGDLKWSKTEAYEELAAFAWCAGFYRGAADGEEGKKEMEDIRLVLIDQSAHHEVAGLFFADHYSPQVGAHFNSLMDASRGHYRAVFSADAPFIDTHREMNSECHAKADVMNEIWKLLIGSETH